MEELQSFAVSPPGFEDLVERELRSIGIRNPAAINGGVEFYSDWSGIYKANLMCRVANRILVRIKTFEAFTFPKLEKELRRIEWKKWLRNPAEAEIKASKHRTKLYHTGKIAEIAAGAMGKAEISAADEKCGEYGGCAAKVYIRIDGGAVTVSIDASGERLQRRGYRKRAVEAPLRENLAAALILRAGWKADEPFLDPMCGSGTFAVEAALMAMQAPPGRNRAFAFENFPEFDRKIWRKIKSEAEASILTRLPAPIFAADSSEEALLVAVESARRAGVADLIQVARADLRELEPPCEHGLLIANPPYGRRLGGAVNAYRAIGQALAGPFRNWRWALVLGGPKAAKIAKIEPSSAYSFKNGGIRLDFAVGGPKI